MHCTRHAVFVFTNKKVEITTAVSSHSVGKSYLTVTCVLTGATLAPVTDAGTSGCRCLVSPIDRGIVVIVSGVTIFYFMSADASTITSASVPSNNVCAHCGTAKKSGKLSCCARGGSWFKNCGDVGDSTFEHTWGEGVQACKSKLAR